MKRTLILIPLLCASCAGLSKSLDPASPIDAAAIAPLVEDVAARHDAYVEADSSATAGDKQRWLRSTDILRRVVAEAQGGAR